MIWSVVQYIVRYVVRYNSVLAREHRTFVKNSEIPWKQMAYALVSFLCLKTTMKQFFWLCLFCSSDGSLRLRTRRMRDTICHWKNKRNKNVIKMSQLCLRYNFENKPRSKSPFSMCSNIQITVKLNWKMISSHWLPHLSPVNQLLFASYTEIFPIFLTNIYIRFQLGQQYKNNCVITMNDVQRPTAINMYMYIL